MKYFIFSISRPKGIKVRFEEIENGLNSEKYQKMSLTQQHDIWHKASIIALVKAGL